MNQLTSAALSWIFCLKFIFPKHTKPNKWQCTILWKNGSVSCEFEKIWVPWLWVSMTSLLMHTVVQSTRPSFRLKTTNQPLKKFLSLAVIWVKVVKNGKILTFKVNFLCQKLSESFFFEPLYFLKWRPIFDDFYSTDHKT